ncbi:MAG TPA: hypothetical protein VGR22_09255 [Thermomicrobiales bacterium]|nr:hypothetical protein [Thermomicrobiales bacterium]
MQHPDLIVLIQHSKQVDASRRQQTSMSHHLPPKAPGELRAAIGRALIALGTRIAPESRPAARREPLGTLPIAGCADI